MWWADQQKSPVLLFFFDTTSTVGPEACEAEEIDSCSMFFVIINKLSRFIYFNFTLF